MTRRSFALIAGVLASAVAAPVHAQLPSITPFSFEVRGGVALPQGDNLGNAETGYTLNGNVTYHAIPLLGVYAGYTYSRFSASQQAVEYDIIDKGFDAGVRVAVPTPLTPIDPWIWAGLVLHDLDFAGDDVSEVESDTKLGFEVGAGLAFGVGPVSLTPGVSYLRYTVDVLGEGNGSSAVEYIRLDVGVRIRL